MILIDKLKKYNLILGSNSPRRKKILEKMGLKINVVASDIDESYSENIKLHEVPVFLAEKKSKALNYLIKEKDILITADTIVLLKNKILSKPKDQVDAKKILLDLSSQTHDVITGVCISSCKETFSFSCSTSVTFNSIDENDIDYYIKKYKPFDKAGSYGIQEWIGLIGINRISGSYSNVVGLPSSRLYHELKRFI